VTAEPIILKKDRRDNYLIYILDQRYLPGRKIYRTCRNYLQVAECIKKMVIRGAPALGVTAAFAVAQAIQNFRHGGSASGTTKFKIENSKKNFFVYLNKVSDALTSTRPTAVNISWAVERMKKVAERNSHLSIPELKKILVKEAEKIYEQNKNMDKRIAENGAVLFKKKINILTHCNTGALATAGYGTALGVIREVFRQGKIGKVYVDETRPYLQGARLTMWELEQENIPAVLICDNMAGYLIWKGEINAVIVGADRIAGNGDTANKIGTYSLAVLAKEHNLPFYIAAPSSSIDLSIPSGKGIKIEERNPNEVKYIQGKLVTLKNAQVCNPTFDITPAEYITAIVTEKGVIRPSYLKNLKLHTNKHE